MTFNDCALECCKQSELIRQFDRLSGTNVMQIFYDKRAPITRMIDEATGYQKELDRKAHEDMQMFLCFIFECVYMPLVSVEAK